MTKRPFVTGIFIIMLLTFLTYSNHFYNTFHFDDFHTIINNANIRSLKNIPRFFTDGSTSSVLPQNQAYRPVVVTSLAIDYWLAGDYYPFWFQTSTFVAFLLQGLLMVFFFKKIFDLSLTSFSNCYLVLIAVTWYLLHPANAETVNYIIARTDVLSTLFILLGFILYIFSPFCRKTYLYLGAVGIGVLCKTTAVMFAPILFFYVLLFEDGLSLTDLFKKIHLKQVLSVFIKTLPAFIFCAFMFWFTGKQTPQTWEPGGTKPLAYLTTQPFVILHYFGEFFLPTSLSADTDWQLLPSVVDIRFMVGSVFILLMLITALYTSRNKQLRPVSFGIIWFFLALAPTSSVIPLAEVLNDHRMYFPFIGLVMSVSWALGLIWLKYRPFIKKEFVSGAVIILLSAYAYGTYRRNEVWHSELSLWHDVTVKSPNNARGLMNYGLSEYSAGNFDEAEKYYKKAEKVSPEYSFIYTNIGLVEEQKGNMAKAENYFLAGVKLGEKFPDPLYFYGAFLTGRQRYSEAETWLTKTIALSPFYMEPRLLLMKVYSLTGQWDKLNILAKQTLSFAPRNAAVLTYLTDAAKKEDPLDIQADSIKNNPTAEKYADLSLLNYQTGRYIQCIDAAEKAIQLKPGFAAAFNNMGAAYIKLGQYDKAIAELKQALILSPAFVLAKNNLFLAEESAESKASKTGLLNAEDYINLSLHYFNTGMYAECIKACNEALAVKPGYDLAYNNLCASYNKLSEWDNAIAAAKKGLQANPKSIFLKNNLAESINGKRSSGEK